ncbi:RNA polymerase sigma factor [Hymenobacter sp. AT01-02]|uniref:RNA polymerase sigma factor n=1 Tax=Hymenobacter sp. AT01-02 TaxID=1571877 RepID=UPI0006E26B62|nr:RNA polymerase sigma-70 factor [Hymenobacter sp. AT01-02]
MPPSPPPPAKHVRLYAAWDDAALVKALAQEDTLAFAELYERYWWPLFEVAYRKVNSREAAEEVVQDLFTALWHKRHQGSTIENVERYLFRAIRYRIIDFIKARMTHAGYVEYSRTHHSSLDHSTEQTVEADDLSVALLAGLMRLPEHTREVFRLSRLEHQTIPEIAEHLNLSRKTVEYHLTRALKSLRLSLRDFITLLLLYLGL